MLSLLISCAASMNCKCEMSFSWHTFIHLLKIRTGIEGKIDSKDEHISRSIA